MGGIRRFLGSLKAWQLALILIPLLFITATLLRFDHLKMLDLRAAVLEADAAEDDAKIAEALAELKSFVEGHIVVNVVEKNGVERVTFGSGPFYLEHQYTRKAAEKLAETQARINEIGDSNPNGNIYQKAREVCEPQAQAYGWAWNSTENITCWTTELSKYPATTELEVQMKADIPNTNLYRYDFASPLWAPTVAGGMVLVCLLIIVVIFIRIFIWLILNISVKFLS